MISLLTLFAVLMAADGWTTWQVLRFGGYEAIPWMTWLMTKLGTYPALLLAKVVPVAVVLYLTKYGVNGTYLTPEVLAWICGAYALVVVNNYLALRRQQRKISRR